MTLIADRYELAEPLGSGGMARVVAARDRILGRRVAVKLVHEGLVGDDASRQRLLREARAAAALHHPNTVAVFDAGEHEGRPFVVMELIEGESLADRLGREGRLDPQETVRITAAVLEGLAAAHDRGLVHRDVKPSNILLPVAGGVKLADFGIAKELSSLATALTQSGHVLGTPRYLAPEQAAGEQAGPHSDLYALGAVAYECLAGRPPFEGDDPLAVALAHRQQPPPPLAERAPGVPDALRQAVERALAKAPGDRHEDARSMRVALEQGLHGVAVGGPGATEALPATAAATVADGPDSSSGTGAAGGRRWWPAAALGAVAIVVLALVLPGLLDGGDAPLEDPEVGSPGEAGPDGEADAGGPADADTTEEAEPEEPRDLDDLISDLARDPDAAGERGDDLLGELMGLRGEDDPGDRAEDARELIRDVGEWLTDDELDAGVAEETLELLEPEARHQDAALHDVSRLYVDVAAAAPDWGERAKQLLDDLEGLLGEDDAEDRAEDARDLIEDLEAWREDGRLEADRADAAIETLRPVAAA